MWIRIFGRRVDEVKPATILAHLQEQGIPATGRFKGDDLGWTSAEICSSSTDSPILVQRYLTEEDALRDDLNTWAGYLETLNYSPNNVLLMERMIQTQQMITIRKPTAHPNEVLLEKLCDTLSRFLAGTIDAFYQIDKVGWHEANGDMLIQEY